MTVRSVSRERGCRVADQAQAMFADDVTVQRGDEIIAEFRGRSRAVAAGAS